MRRGPRAAAAGRAAAATPGWAAAGLVAVLLGGAASAAGEEPWFTDEAAAWGLDFVHLNGMTGELYFCEMMGAGAALVDYDNDGDLDAYLVQGGPLEAPTQAASGQAPAGQETAGQAPSDRLYRNDGGGPGEPPLRFTDVTAAAGIEAPGYGMGVAAGDVDNDGWVDLYVTNFGPNQMLRSNGDGTFADVTEETRTGDARWSVSAAFLDYDRDGWLDLYVGNYVDFRLATHRQCTSPTGRRQYCGPLAYLPEGDRLLRNRGDGTFEDATARAGIAGGEGGALGVVAADFDGDGWTDVYVANDQTANQLWINQRDGTFRDEALLAGCALSWEGQAQASMGVHAADFDGDGDEDLFMTHLTGETNTLYLNDGRGLFRDATVASGLGPPSWEFTAFGTAGFDYDNDGRLDLLAANGAVRIIEALAERGDPHPLHQPNQLFRGLGGGRFTEVTAQAGPVFELSEVSRGAAFGDVDNDGDVDVLLTNNDGPARLLVNRLGQDQNWVGLRFTGAHPPGEREGARLELRASGNAPVWRRSHRDGSYASASDPRVLFGLAEHNESVTIKLHPAAARRSEWRQIRVERYSVIPVAIPDPGETDQ